MDPAYYSRAYLSSAARKHTSPHPNPQHLLFPGGIDFIFGPFPALNPTVPNGPAFIDL